MSDQGHMSEDDAADTSPALAVLYCKRVALANEITDLKRRLDDLREDLKHLEATIQMLQPDQTPMPDLSTQIAVLTRDTGAMGPVKWTPWIRSVLLDYPDGASPRTLGERFVAERGITEPRFHQACTTRIHVRLAGMAENGEVERIGSRKGVKYRLAQRGNGATGAAAADGEPRADHPTPAP